MAWTTPITFTTGNILTAAQMNTNVRDNENYLFDQPMALVTKVGSTTISNAVTGDFIFGATVYSSPGITVSLAGGSLTPTFAGVFECWANIAWSASSAGSRQLMIYGAGASSFASTCLPSVSAGNHILQSCSGITNTILNGSTDGVRMQVYQDSGIAQTVFGTSTTNPAFAFNEPCYMGIKMLGTGS